MSMAMSSPIRRGNIFCMSETRVLRSTTASVRICWRLKASSWRVRETARCAAFSTSSACSFSGLLGSSLRRKNLAVADDDAEKIVEVVGDSAGEAADGFHLSGHAELLFEGAALGDVFGEDFVDRGGLKAFVEMAAAAAHGDGLIVFALPLDFDVFEFAFAAEEFDETIEVGGIAEDGGAEIGFDEFAGSRVFQHALERGIDAEELAVGGGAVDSVRRALRRESEAGFGLAQGFGGFFAIGDVATDDDEFLGHAFRVDDDAGGRFENAPGAVFVANAVFEGLALSGAARFGAGFLDATAIVGMNLVETGGAFQFGERVAESALVGDAVVDAVAFHVHDGDEVGGVFTDETEELFALEELAADAMDLELLKDRVEIEEQNKADQAPDGLLEVEKDSQDSPERRSGGRNETIAAVRSKVTTTVVPQSHHSRRSMRLRP